MAPSKKIATILIGMFLAIYQEVKGDPYYSCNGNTYDANGPIAAGVESVLKDLVDYTPTLGYDFYDNYFDPTGVHVYGHGFCQGTLSSIDCGSCILTAVNQIHSLCPLRVGAQLQLTDCRIRYELYSFSE